MSKYNTIAIVSKLNSTRIKERLRAHGYKIVKKNPDLVLSYGGDGTILHSERVFPSVPKIAIKATRVCRNCDYEAQDLEKIMRRVKDGKFKISEQMKLKARVKGRELVALNEIQVRSKLPIHALRFSLEAGGKKFSNIIGDGVIIATPFGSTAYYSSTGGRKFDEGIGISFNNVHNKRIKYFVVPEKSRIKVKIERGPALLIADNNEKFINLKRGDRVTVERSKQKARFVLM